MGGVGFEDERRIRTHGSVAGKTPNGRRTQQSASKRTEGDEKVSVDREVQYVFISFFFFRATRLRNIQEKGGNILKTF